MGFLKSLILAVANPTLRFYRTKIVGLSHQRSDMARAQEKWRLIESELPETAGSLLDIGCNEGYFTLQAAEKGWCGWGIEIIEKAVRYARHEAAQRNLDTALFFNAPLTPEAVERMPHFDVILFMSSFHDFHQVYGGARAYEMFDNLLRACRQKMILEPASTTKRFSATEPVFSKDNDREAIEEWVRTLVARSPGWTVRYVGETAYSEVEPYRFMFSIERAPQHPASS
ncbi:MAG: methyltransferase domain-containing protein [Alphaproteobacteria bacterium]|nr:methyltransferase domain-containing protein [Alphaproteobacteria bacterium]